MTTEQTKGRRAFIQRLGAALIAAVAFCEDKLFGRTAAAPNVTRASLHMGTGDVRIYSEGTIETTHFLMTDARGDDKPIPELENHVAEIVWRLSATDRGEAKLTKRDGEIQIVLAPVPLLSRFDNFIPGTPAEVKRHAEALLAVAAQLQAIEDENVRSGKWQRDAPRK